VLLNKVSLLNSAVMIVGGSGIALCLALAVDQQDGKSSGATVQSDPAKAAPDNTPAQTVLEQALQRVPSLEDSTYRVWTLCMIARAQASADLRIAAAATLRMAVRAALDTESDHRVIDVAECAAQLGDAEAAVTILNALDEPQLSRNGALLRLATAQAKRGELRGAKTTAECIPFEDSMRAEALQSIATSQADAGDFNAARATVARIGGAAAKTRVLSFIATQQLRAGDKTTALQTLQEAVQCVGGKNSKPGEADPFTLAAIAGVQAEAGQLEEGRKTAQDLPMGQTQDVAWQNIAVAQVRQGEADAALQTAKRITDDFNQGETIRQIVIGQIVANDLAAARRTTVNIRLPVWRGYALVEIGKAEARRGQRQDAADTFRRVLQEVAQVQDTEFRGNLKPALLANLAEAQASVGEESVARVWIDSESSNVARVFSLVGLAKGLVKQRRGANPPKVVIFEEEVTPGNVRVFDSQASAKDADLKDLLERKKTRPEAVQAPGWQFGDSATFRGRIILFGRLIQAIQPDGTGLELIHELRKDQSIVAGRVAPDGRRLAFSVITDGSDRAEIYVLGADGRLRKVADDGIVQAWSPDGTRLAFFRTNQDDFQNFILDLVNGREQQIPLPKADWVNDWSPDGQRLAVVAGNPDKTFKHPTKGIYPLRKIYLTKTDGLGREDLQVDALLDNICARFAPDGKYLLYHQRKHKEGRVLHFSVICRLDGGGAKEIFQFDTFFKGNREYRSTGFPCWSPAGKEVVWLVPRQKTEYSTLKMNAVFVSTLDSSAKVVDLHEKGIGLATAVEWR
jgi:hypothetical protein